MIERDALFLMANLGSEVSRALQFRDAHDCLRSQQSAARAQNIADQLTALPEMQSRISELQVLHDVISDIPNAQPRYHITSDDLNGYFMPFALRYASNSLT
ncbi:hypothetical protein A3A38_00440 [Candidatus Kaiserbacteria bacterium RIFCSPLOWO2_01_FULL_53_17]|uniref:Uncharacterized protein n=1 Tax=Candidatus Kaiserbacteria bacterium RIFCSPLOWO2_01_FULL_53_17 TaxID=1798511 RepID=A0A1F6EIE3_9BACT|nr:MAG: hypothetical protein A3A38_00440 [Candidatus Kaiserbacteria bacterium RIFCSPLOWO2_01_FULL_53_17]